MKNKTVKIATIGCGVLLTVGIFVAVLYPPIQGVYNAPAFAFLDGSEVTVLFRDGIIYCRNEGGESGTSVVEIGTYRKVSPRRLWIETSYLTCYVHVSVFGMQLDTDVFDDLNPEARDMRRRWFYSTRPFNID